MDKEEVIKTDKAPEDQIEEKRRTPVFSPKMIGAIADEVSKSLMSRLPGMISRPKRKVKKKTAKKIDNSIFLDTSAIIDRRIFDVINLGLLNGTIVIPPSI